MRGRISGGALILTLAVFLSALLLGGGRAQASLTCSASGGGGANFGTIYTDRPVSYSATLAASVTCSGGTPGEAMLICYSVGASSAGQDALNGLSYLADGSSLLLYGAYLNASDTLPATVGTNYTAAFTLNLSGAGSASVNLYYLLISGQTSAPAGSYTTNSSVKVVVGPALSLGLGCGGAYTSSTTLPVTVQATNTAECQVSNATLSFGTVGLLTANVDQSGAIDTTCTYGLSYTIGLDGGQHGGTSATNRQMVNGGYGVTYGLFTDAARSQGWFGPSYSATGSGVQQAAPVYGRVPPQTTPPANTYSDTVVITVTY